MPEIIDRVCQALEVHPFGIQIAEMLLPVLNSNDPEDQISGGNMILAAISSANSQFVELHGDDLHMNPTQEEALRIVNSAEDPLTASDVSELAHARTLRSKSNASSTLNWLVEHRKCGKISRLGMVYFTTPQDAVYHATQELLMRRPPGAKITIDDAEDLARMTGLRRERAWDLAEREQRR